MRDIREIFRRAAGDEAPDVGRLDRAVPTILAQAQRVRRYEQDPAARIVAVAWAWLPRFAVATALLAAAALVWPGASRRVASVDEASVVDAWLVTGTVSTSVADPALDALLRQGTR